MYEFFSNNWTSDVYGDNAAGMGEGAILFTFDDEGGEPETVPDGIAIQKGGREAEMSDTWWTEKDDRGGNNGSFDNAYNKMYKAWRNKADERDYRMATFPETLTDRNMAGFAVSDGRVVSLERDNEQLQKLRIFSLPTVANFRNEITTKVGEKSLNGTLNNKGVIKSVNFSKDYKRFPLARIHAGHIVIPFADTKHTAIDPRQEMEDLVEKTEEIPGNITPEEGIGISGAIRGIKCISDVDGSTSSSVSDVDPYIEGGVIYIPKLPFDGIVLAGDGEEKETLKFKDLENGKEYRIAFHPGGYSTSDVFVRTSITMKTIKGTGVDSKRRYLQLGVYSALVGDGYVLTQETGDWLNEYENGLNVYPPLKSKEGD